MRRSLYARAIISVLDPDNRGPDNRGSTVTSFTLIFLPWGESSECRPLLQYNNFPLIQSESLKIMIMTTPLAMTLTSTSYLYTGLCGSNPCDSGSTCVDIDGHYECLCSAGQFCTDSSLCTSSSLSALNSRTQTCEGTPKECNLTSPWGKQIHLKG